MAGIIQEAFDSYRTAAMDAGASAVQVTECRRAFYAGWHTSLLLADSMSEGDGCTESDLALVTSVHAELAEFVKDVKEGRA